MKKHQKVLSLLCCLLCCCLCLSACKTNAPTSASQEPVVIYTITVKTAGGMVLEDLVAYVFEGDTEKNMLTYGTLDSNGTYTFTAPRSDNYTVRFANLPEEGYDLQEYYAITDTTTNIVLTSSVVSGKDALESGKSYQLGDVMRDFTVTTVDGEELRISQILQQKQAVVLNFWHTGEAACVTELPLLQEAYDDYADRLEVIAMNPTDISGDTVDQIIQFRDTHGLTLPMATCQGQWFGALGISSYPATVIIDRYGVICLLDNSAVEDAGVFEAAFAHFTAADYSQQLLTGFSELHTVEYPLGHVKNPYQTNGAAGEFTVTVEPGAEFHVQFYKDGPVVLRIEDPSVYVIYGGNRLDPDSKGVVEVELNGGSVMGGESVVIGNTGVTTASFAVRISIPKGSYSNPYVATLGQQTVTVKADNDQGLFYQWTAEAAGVLTVTVTGAPEQDFDIQLYNLNTYALRTLSEEELVDEAGNRYVSIAVNKGDVVSIGYLSLPDASGQYPKVKLDVLLSFEEGSNVEPNYSITVTDGEGNPMAGVSVSLTVDGVNTVFVSDENGWIPMFLPSGIYTVKVTVPDGYECSSTQFLLTTANAHKDLVMTLYVPQEVPYTVYVVDEFGNPVANAAVVLGDSFHYTDELGMVSVILLESRNYVATVVPPEGYTVSKSDHAFGTETVITVVLGQQSPTVEEMEYTVQIVDHNGNPYKNLLVRLTGEDGAVVTTESVSADGKVTMWLPKANYTVTLVFTAGNAMGYESTTAKLSPANAAITIEVVPYAGSTGESILVGDAAYDAAYTGIGSVYVDLSSQAMRYFLFTPTQTGIYTFTTTNGKAAIGYWGTTAAIADQTAAYVQGNVCTLEVKAVGESYVLSVSGGAGISGTVLKIARIGDVMVEEIFTGTTLPTTPCTVANAGSKTYLDLSQPQTLVKGSDGLYHLGSAEGAVVYMDLLNSRYGIGLAKLAWNGQMVEFTYDASGRATRSMDYNACMCSYVSNVDMIQGVYALTDDLITMVQNYGNYAGWYDTGSANYLFGTETVADGCGWMFLLCVFQSATE